MGLCGYRTESLQRQPPFPFLKLLPVSLQKIELPFSETQQYLPRGLQFLKDKQKEFEATYSAVPGKKTQPRFTLKKLVQRLHIQEPAQHVHALLGYRYPSNLQEFSRSRLPGPWESSRAGKRMKLSQPQTWERELSLRGNKACVWEELIGRVALTITLLCCSCLCLWTLTGFPWPDAVILWATGGITENDWT